MNNDKTYHNIEILDESRLFYTLGTIIFLFLLLIGSSFISQNAQKKKTPEQKINYFENINLEASSAVVYEIKTGKVIYAKDELALRPLASITKLMTALATKRLTKGDNEQVTISRSDLRSQGDSGLRPGERFNLGHLIDLVLTSSSNDGSEALAALGAAKLTPPETFPENMNNLARAIGLKGLLFENPTGLDGSEINAGAYGSALDIAKLLSYIVVNDPKMISATRYQNITIESENKLKHSAKNTNDALAFIPGLIGGKTGFTDLSGGNLAIAFDAGLGNPYAVVVLGSSEDGRFEDIKKLVQATIAQNTEAK